MPEDEILLESNTVVRGETQHSPEKARANALRLTLAAGGGSSAMPPLLLYGYFNLDTAIAGRYSSSLPAPVRVVVVSRKSGSVYMATLARQDDIPPRYLGAGALASIEGPNGPVIGGISESGYFTVDLKAHLGLPDEADTYDAFLWLEDIASDLATADKPAESGSRPGNLKSYRPSSIATINNAALSDSLDLSVGNVDGERYLRGRAGISRVSIAAYCVTSGQQAWIRLESKNSSGMEFSIKTADLLPGSKPNDRILAFAIEAGRRSTLLDTAAGHGSSFTTF